ncbi:MAG: hypothetical protein ACYDCO_07040 [Armatimonadota bacterium]
MPQHHEPGFSEPSVRTAMCTLTIIYHEDFEPDIVSILQRHLGVPRYTKIQGVVGARQAGLAETEYESSDCRHMLVSLAERETIYAMLDDLRDLRTKKGHGLRGYVSPAEEVI